MENLSVWCRKLLPIVTLFILMSVYWKAEMYDTNTPFKIIIQNSL